MPPTPLLQPHAYQPALALRFDAVRRRLAAVLPHDTAIEHVGASAIPGALSKGDLDIAVRVPAAAAHAGVVQRLCALRYVPARDTLRTHTLCMLQWPNTDEAHALQVVAAGSRFDMFTTFRDALRAQPALVARYNQLKTDAANGTEDAYRAAKAAFIREVLDGLGHAGRAPGEH